MQRSRGLSSPSLCWGPTCLENGSRPNGTRGRQSRHPGRVEEGGAETLIEGIPPERNRDAPPTEKGQMGEEALLRGTKWGRLRNVAQGSWEMQEGQVGLERSCCYQWAMRADGDKMKGQDERTDVRWSRLYLWERLELVWSVNGCRLRGSIWTPGLTRPLTIYGNVVKMQPHGSFFSARARHPLSASTHVVIHWTMVTKHPLWTVHGAGYQGCAVARRPPLLKRSRDGCLVKPWWVE